MTAQFTLTTSHAKLTPCAGGFSATAAARLRVTSTDARLAGTISLRLSEIANTADDAWVSASGVLKDGAGRLRGNVTLTGVDRGNDLNGMIVVRLTNHRGVIVANASSHQDSFNAQTGVGTGHGELGTNDPLAPDNSAVDVRASCTKPSF